MKKLKLLGLSLVLLLGRSAVAADTISATASCGAAGSLVLNLGGPAFASALIEVGGTYTGDVTFNVTGSQKLAYVALPVTPIPLGAQVTKVTGTGGAVTFQAVVQAVGYSFICVTGANWVSGTASVTLTPLVSQWEPLFTDVPVGNPTSVYNSVTAPGAGAVIATITPGAGTYDVTATIAVGANAVAAETDNMQLQVGAGVIQRLLIAPTANGLPVQYTFRRVAVPAATAVTINAVGAGTASCPYKATLSLLPVN